MPADELRCVVTPWPMVEVLMTSIATIIHQDIRDAVTKDSKYREESARQWAVRAAQRAFEFYPELRGEPKHGR